MVSIDQCSPLAINHHVNSNLSEIASFVRQLRDKPYPRHQALHCASTLHRSSAASETPTSRDTSAIAAPSGSSSFRSTRSLVASSRHRLQWRSQKTRLQSFRLPQHKFIIALYAPSYGHWVMPSLNVGAAFLCQRDKLLTTHVEHCAKTNVDC